jgi:hypothetical protein
MKIEDETGIGLFNLGNGRFVNRGIHAKGALQKYSHS